MKLVLASLASVLLLATMVTTAEAGNVPTWVKNNAGWWADGQIDDNSFVTGIQWMIENDIIQVPSTTRSSATSDEIPDWIKNTAGWWATDAIGENDFVNAIQYLIKMGIMSVSSSAVGDDMAAPSQYQSSTSAQQKQSKSTGDASLDEMLLQCQDKPNKREIRDCEKVIKEEYKVNQYKSDATAYVVGPVTFYYIPQQVEVTASGQANLFLVMLAENTGGSGNTSMMCTSPAVCNYKLWDGGKHWNNSGSDFTSGSVVLKPGQARFIQIFWGPAIGYGSYEDFEYDPNKSYTLQISEPFGKKDIPLSLFT